MFGDISLNAPPISFRNPWYLTLTLLGGLKLRWIIGGGFQVFRVMMVMEEEERRVESLPWASLLYGRGFLSNPLTACSEHCS